MKVIAGVLMSLLVAQETWACTVCFTSVENDPANKALTAGISALLIVLAVIMGIFLKFIYNFARRAKEGL